MQTSTRSVALIAALLGSSQIANAVGYLGFVPNDTNVISPTFGGAPVNSWKQTGSCSASAVQISPHWVLSTNHAQCSVGRTFRRQIGAQIVESVVDLDIQGLAAQDLHLARLKDAIPYDGEFAPLVEDIRGSMTNFNQYDGIDVLTSGYGKALSGQRILQVGWAPLFSSFQINVSPANPHLAAFPTPTDGDSGGAVLVVTNQFRQGALAGLMRSPSAGIGSTWGFGQVVRQTIDATLSNSGLNPSGERVNWIAASEIIGAASKPKTSVPFFKNEGNFNSDTGLVTSTSPGTLTIHIPKADIPDLPLDEGVTKYYRIRLLHESHLNSAYGSFDFMATKPAFNQDWFIGSGIYPGKWYMTVSNVIMDPVDGTAESLANRRIEFSIPQANQRPQSLDSVNMNFTDLDLGDGQRHWCVDLTPVAGKGAAPEGVLWSVFGQTWRMPMNDTGALCDTWDPTGLGNTPGKEFTVQAWPYIGAALGPVTSVKVVAP